MGACWDKFTKVLASLCKCRTECVCKKHKHIEIEIDETGTPHIVKKDGTKVPVSKQVSESGLIMFKMELN